MGKKASLAAIWAAIGLLASSPALPQTAPGGRLVEVAGAKLYVQVLGQGSPILFLHGGMQFFDNAFSEQREVFAADHTVIGIDQRSHGHSPDGAWSLSYEGMADDTATVLTQLKLGPVDVVGHSDGGNIALLLALKYPALIRRIVISGANLRSNVSAEELERRRHLPPEELDAKVTAVMAAMPPNFRSDYAKVSPDGADHFKVLAQKDYFLWMTPIVIAPADLQRIAAPTLVIAGDHDFTSIEETVEIYRGLAHGQLLLVPGTGHGTLHQRPQLLNLAIREFLAQP